MKVLGIDYGRRRVGIAISFNGVVETRPILKGKGAEILVAIKSICKKEKIDLIVIGISEGKTAQETRRFAKEIENVLELPVTFQDETLTTKEAGELKRGKAEELDSVAAAILLERFWFKKERR